MPGSWTLWSVQRGAMRGIKARDSSTSSAQVRLSRFGTSRGMPKHLPLQFMLAARYQLIGSDFHRVRAGPTVKMKHQVLHVIDLGDSFENGENVRFQNRASEFPSILCWSSAKRMEKFFELVLGSGFRNRRLLE